MAVYGATQWKLLIPTSHSRVNSREDSRIIYCPPLRHIDPTLSSFIFHLWQDNIHHTIPNHLHTTVGFFIWDPISLFSFLAWPWEPLGSHQDMYSLSKDIRDFYFYLHKAFKLHSKIFGLSIWPYYFVIHMGHIFSVGMIESTVKLKRGA